MTDDKVNCWGLNNRGQLGNGNTIDQYQPAQIGGLAGVAELATGAQHTCALFGGNLVKCWGSNSYGNLGNGSTTDSLVPVTVLDR